MPTPVSLTGASMDPSFGAAATSIRPPSGVNLIALGAGSGRPAGSSARPPELTKPRIHGRVQRDAAAPGPLPDQHQEMEIREVQFHPRAAARTELFDYLETAPIWRSSSSSRLP